MIETLLVGSIVAAAATYVGWTIWRSVRRQASHPCAACRGAKAPKP